MTVHVKRRGTAYDWTKKDDLGLDQLKGFRYESLPHITEHISLLFKVEKVEYLIMSNFN